MGDVLFLVASFLTAGYTVIMRKSKLDPVHVAALVATGSLVIYAPFISEFGDCISPKCLSLTWAFR